ncbi:MAG: hypothetical protein E6R03_16600 [Hyphomicrobiaceae bacterium]|nr:MAG: hypothetical protein E6R03_16600 [Hyphomicrobiaceae bacterium]
MFHLPLLAWVAEIVGIQVTPTEALLSGAVTTLVGALVYMWRHFESSRMDCERDRQMLWMALANAECSESGCQGRPRVPIEAMKSLQPKAT